MKNLLSPTAAITSDSAAIIWENDEQSKCVFHIYSNGEHIADTEKTDYTLENLTPDTIYTVRVIAENYGGEVGSEEITLATKPASKIYNITDYGAVGDGKTLCTSAIQKTIDECETGSTVYIPAGEFISGALFLKSNMTLFIDKGAVLRGSTSLSDYPIMKYRFEGLETDCYASLINTYDGTHENITIAGHGTINAMGAVLRPQQLKTPEYKPGRAVCIRNTTNLYFKDIVIRQSPAWCVHTIYCKNVVLNNIEIHSKYDENGNRYEGIVNGDGFDPDSCQNVYVFNSLIASQDDCIAIKSGRNEEGRAVGIPSENIRITNCRFVSGFGIAVGSESSGCVRNVFVSDCEFKDSFSIISLKPPRGRGGVIENVLCKNCNLKNEDTTIHDCEWYRGGINIDMFYSHREFNADRTEELNDGTPLIRNVTLSNLTLDTVGGNAIYIMGLPESRIMKLYLENITAHGKYGMKAKNADILKMENVNVTADEGREIIIFD